MEHKPAPKWARAYLTFALVLSVVPLLLILAGAIGTKVGLWSWKFGFGAIMVASPFGVGWAPALAILAIVVALVGVIVSISAGLWRRAMAALVISLLTMGAFVYLGGQARKAPPIHDVSTDWREPLAFSDRVKKQRGAEANPVEPDPVVPDRAPALAGQKISDVNAQTCPGAKPVLLPVAADRAYAIARRTIRKQRGLDIVTESPETGRIEATATSYWYGFKDDVVVRVQPDGSGTRIDLRSVSRVGMSDLGANCKRITSLAAAMRQAGKA
jgi:fatty-acyl-CoA synthase